MTNDGFRPDRRLTDQESEEDLDAEIHFHLEERVRRLQAGGMSEEDARAEALRRFGDVAEARTGMAREEQKRRWTMGMRGLFDGFRADMGVGIRQWRARPGMGLLALITLTLGIGATTAIFSLVDGILFRPLPFAAPDRLVSIWSDWTERGGPDKEWFGYPDLIDVREQVDAFEHVGLWGGFSPVLTGMGDPEQISGMNATYGTLSQVFRIQPVLGRLFTEEDDRPGANPVIVISHEFWQNRLGGGADVLGSTLTLGGIPQEIVGVLPEGFDAPFQPGIDIWSVPGIDPAAVANSRGGANWRAVARMNPGMTLDGANQQLRVFADRLREQFPESYVGQTPVAYGMQEDLVEPAREGLQMVFVAVGLVLLLASVNVANLLLARNSLREGELAVRAALGAGRGRIVRQLLTETGVLAVVGGALGIGVGWLGTRVLVALAPDGTPRLAEVTLDSRVLGFAVLTTILTTLIAGVLPALRSGRTDLRDALVGGGRDPGADRSGLRLRGGLVVVQVGLAVALMATAGVLGRSFQQLRAVDLGFDASDVVTFFVSLPGAAYTDTEARAAFLAELDTRLNALPQVVSAGGVGALPLANFNGDVTYTIEGRPLPEPGQETAGWLRRVTPGYMEAMDLRIIAGRGIDARDSRDAPNAIVINETLAERFPGQNPIGQRISLGSPDNPLWFDIVGIVGNIRNFDVRDDWRDAIYISNTQFPTRQIFFAIEAAEGVDPTSLLPAARATLAEMDGSLAIAQAQPMSELVEGALGPDRFLAVLLSGFAALALVLAVVGLYGVVSYAVTARLREVGVRMALGAGRGPIRLMVVGRSLVPVGMGVGLGLVLTWFATRLAASLLYGVSPIDPASIAATVGVLLVTASMAAAVPAFRASGVDPVHVLRQD